MIIEEENKISKKTANMDLVSVIIVTYNAAETLQNCLNSIYAQTYQAIEIIVIDGNSTDSTQKILEKNASHIAYWKSEPDHGIYDAMNKALTYTKGQWIYFLGADDELRPEFSDIIPLLKSSDTIYYANVYADGAKRVGQLNRYQFAKYGPYHQAMIYSKSVFDKYKFDLKYKISADFALTLKLCGDKTFQFIYEDYTLANFNHTGISGMKIDMPFQKDKPFLVWKNFGFGIWLRYIIRRIKSPGNSRA
jgi:glycosyltransferase involved in cell wall biosynthesis